MRWRQVLVLWLVCAVLAVVYVVVERPVSAPEAPVARPRFLPVEPASVREVRLERGGVAVIARRRGDVWEVIEPAGAPVPPGLIAAFTSALAGAEEIAHVAGPEADAESFGLARGAVRVVLASDAGGTIEVAMGETNPAGTAIYARRVGAPDVVLIGRQVRYYEDLIFQALSAGRAPATEGGAPVGG